MHIANTFVLETGEKNTISYIGLTHFCFIRSTHSYIQRRSQKFPLVIWLNEFVFVFSENKFFIFLYTKCNSYISYISMHEAFFISTLLTSINKTVLINV